MGRGSPTWISGEPLPRALTHMASVSLDMSILLIGTNTILLQSYSVADAGGRDGGRNIRDEILSYSDGTWSEVGELEVPKYDHASTKIMLSPDVCN